MRTLGIYLFLQSRRERDRWRGWVLHGEWGALSRIKWVCVDPCKATRCTYLRQTSMKIEQRGLRRRVALGLRLIYINIIMGKKVLQSGEISLIKDTHHCTYPFISTCPSSGSKVLAVSWMCHSLFGSTSIIICNSWSQQHQRLCASFSSFFEDKGWKICAFIAEYTTIRTRT